VTQSDSKKGNYRIIEHMYALEWVGESNSVIAKITNAPGAVVAVSHSIGGWSYDSFDIELKKARTTYTIDLKTTAGSVEHD
jgi:hypothetical protein